MSRCQSLARIVGTGMTALSQAKVQRADAVGLMVEALQLAVRDASMKLEDLDTLIALPSLMSDQHFMIGHAVAQKAGVTPRRGVLVRTLDVGGAGPIAALIAAKHAIEHEGRTAVAIVAGDTVASVPIAEFLARADGSCRPREHRQGGNTFSSSCGSAHAAAGGGMGETVSTVPSPVIPNLYDRMARWHMQQYGTTREQLAMCASLMTYQASKYPAALHKRPRLLQEVLSAAPVAPVTTKLECAKLADGAAAVVVVPAGSQYDSSKGVAMVGGGEGSGPLYPPDTITENCFSASTAADAAYRQAGVTPADIDYWGLYDCFPICLIRAIEAVGLAAPGQAGNYIQQQYQRLLGPLEQQQWGQQPSSLPQPQQQQQQAVWPVNTHGGLLGFGAPWEVPAMHSLIEAVTQLREEAVGRQVPGAKRALVYGNGGVFSASAVAILERQQQRQQQPSKL
eukprot:GHUV01005737.1.p1 GENE.GHUV01005737.1~~GHUV01005737.1.p1  ORF type:complete len:517 (+),score=149.24 GHUV01005737.1:195-1553(+)